MAHPPALHRVFHVVSCLLLSALLTPHGFAPLYAQQPSQWPRTSSLKVDDDPFPMERIGYEGLNEVIPLPSGGFFVDGYGKHPISLLTASKQLRRHVRYHDINGPTRFGLYQDSLVWVWSAGDSTARLVSE
jgi:hypothetical protein